jgi:DNA mismatch repair protein MutL
VAAGDAKQGPWAWCRIVGQVGGLYVLLETEDGYVVMDPHAAHERVLFDRYMRDLEKRSVASQPLLVPETVELLPRDAMRIRQNLEVFQEMGFGVSEFGGDTFVVEAVPACFGSIGAKELLIEITSHLEMAGSRGGRTRWREDAVAQAACKAAVKSRDRLRIEEMEKLVADLAATSLPYTCPHGRPTMIYTSFQELNRKFGRG